MSIMGPVWAPNFLLDTTRMRLQDPSNTLMLRWYLQPQTLPKAWILSVWSGCIAYFKHPAAPQRASIMSIMGPVWAPNFLLYTTQYEASRPLQEASRPLQHSNVEVVFTATNTAKSMYFERFVGLYSAF